MLLLLAVDEVFVYSVKVQCGSHVDEKMPYGVSARYATVALEEYHTQHVDETASTQLPQAR